MNEKFYNISEEKQQKILNAAMEVFGNNKYKRAATDLIASKAGISKGLLFYYFHNKKELYLYVYDYLIGVMKAQIVDTKFREITDFFELLEYSVERKTGILGKNPHIMEFAMRAFYSDKEDVSDELKKTNMMQEDKLYKMYFGHIETYKFKESVNPYSIYKMLRWMADGYMHELHMNEMDFEIGALKAEYRSWMGMMKMLVYKEEYQDECN